MSREVHSGPTDRTQARGAPFSGDPEGGDGTQPQTLDKLALDSLAPRAGGADGAVRRL